MRCTALASVILAACGSSESKQPAGGSAGSAAAYEPLGTKPANARRPSPPPGIESKALAVGAKAPAVALVESAGAPWQLTESLARHARVMLVTGRLGLGFPILADPKAEAFRAFGVFDEDSEVAWPSIFIVGKDGTVVKRWLADTYSQRVATDDVLRDL